MLNSRRNHSQRRKRILELLQGTNEHPTADWVYEQLKKEFPDLSLGTVYRNLRILAEEGHIISIHNGSTYDRFDADMSNHQHLICERCNKIIDIRVDLQDGLLKQLEKETGFQVPTPRLSLTGICPDCHKKV